MTQPHTQSSLHTFCIHLSGLISNHKHCLRSLGFNKIHLHSLLCLSSLFWLSNYPMQENIQPSVWPPICSHAAHATGSWGPSMFLCATPTWQIQILKPDNTLPVTPTNLTPISWTPFSNVVNTSKSQPRYCNGYKTKLQTPSYKLYVLNS